MLYENYGLNIFGNAQSIKISIDGEISFYFINSDIRDRALGRIRSALKIEGKLPVSELCKYHKLLTADEHDSDRGWTKEDLDGIGIGYNLSDETYTIALPTPKKFEPAEETKERNTDLGAFRKAFSVEETSDKGLKFSFKSSTDRDKAYKAFKNCLLVNGKITIDDLCMCLLNYSNDWAIFMMVLIHRLPPDLGWNTEDIGYVVAETYYRPDDDRIYNLFLPAPKKLELKNEKTDTQNESPLFDQSAILKRAELLEPFREAYSWEEHEQDGVFPAYINITFRTIRNAEDAKKSFEQALQTAPVRIIDVLHLIPLASYSPLDIDYTYGWTKTDDIYCIISGWSTSCGDAQYTLSLPKPKELEVKC